MVLMENVVLCREHEFSSGLKPLKRPKVRMKVNNINSFGAQKKVWIFEPCDVFYLRREKSKPILSFFDDITMVKVIHCSSINHPVSMLRAFFSVVVLFH